MSQQLVPVSGGVQQVQTSNSQRNLSVLSVQGIKARKLENNPTEWQLTGRPIYSRLPSVSDTYQINFFDLLPAVNTAVALGGTQDIGYVYIPWGEGIFGPLSTEVVSSETRENLLIKAGQVVWKYGTTVVPPAILNLKELDFESGRYLVTYQLVYDDAPVENYYRVEDYSLAGTKLKLSSSSDGVIGWRYPSFNAFLDSSTYWSNSDNYFPSYAQPTQSYIQWESNENSQSSANPLPSAYSQVVVRCPEGSSYGGRATLSYVNSEEVSAVVQAEVSRDTLGQYFQFDIESPSLQTAWRIDFSDLNIKIQALTVSGVVAKLTKPSGPSTRCALSIYPADVVPTTVTNLNGEEVPAIYCNLAYIDVDSNYTLTDIQDVRSIIHREYKPVSDWLTTPYDEDLMRLHTQVEGYSALWMSPTVGMRHEYLNLESYGVELN